MEKEKAFFFAAIVTVVALVGSCGVFFGSTVSAGTALSAASYRLNGLTCPVPSDYLRYRSVTSLLPEVTMSPGFLNLAKGMPFGFGNAENITDRILQIDGRPHVRLPDALEMVFYSGGPDTSCGMLLNKAQAVIDAQVPIQNGAYNITGTTLGTLTPSGGPRTGL